MPLIDPADLELEAVQAMADFAGCQVVEIGTGDARLAWPLAEQAARWVALDNDRAELRAAADELAQDPLAALRLVEGDGRALPLGGECCDIAFFTWSLCCVPHDGMAQALAEAGRVLRAGGLLLDVHPTADPIRMEVWQALKPHSSRNTPLARDYRRLPLGAFAADDTLADFAAATAAIDGAGPGLVQVQASTFEYLYFFEDLDELTEYLEENEEMNLAGDDLLERAVLALNAATTRAWLVLIQPVLATSLRKRTG